MATFQEGATKLGNSNIDVSQSTYRRQQNAPDSVKFKTGGNFSFSVGDSADYLDINGNTIISGSIRRKKELNKGGTDTIYEVEIFDEGHLFVREILNKVVRDKTPEEIIKEIVEDFGFTFQNNLPFTSSQNVEKKVYVDFKPIEAINELVDTLNALWETDGTTFKLYQRGDNQSSVDLNENSTWVNPDGFEDNTDKQAKSVVVRGKEVLQRTNESFSGTFSSVTLAREPVDVEVLGLTQTTEDIDGDYKVDVQNKTITFENDQTDPTVNYSYYSQIRVRSGQEEPVVQIERKYIETTFEARELARAYLDKYENGITTAKFESSDLFNVNVNNIRPGDSVSVTAKDTSRSGDYIIREVKRKYPNKIVVTIGEDTSSLWDWQKEAKDRIKQLEVIDRNSDFVQLDSYSTGSFSVDFSAELTDLYYVENTGEVLWARDTPFSNDADLISDTGQDSEYAIAYDDDGLPSSSVTDVIGNSESLQ